MVEPFFWRGVLYYNYVMILAILFCPQDPPINADYGIIEIYTSLAPKPHTETEPDINNGIDQSHGINQNIFNPTEPHTGNTGEDGKIFKPASLLYAFNKFQPYLVN